MKEVSDSYSATQLIHSLEHALPESRKKEFRALIDFLIRSHEETLNCISLNLLLDKQINYDWEYDDDIE